MDLLRLEQQRQALENNLQTLRNNLKHWQTWEAEYEGLKEEIESTGNDLNEAQLAQISTTYDGELVNEHEIRQLTGLAEQNPRTASQIVSMITRRQDYVQKNIETIQRRFWDDEAKLEELDFAAFSAASRNGDAGFPLTEIHEELDDDDNVVSSSTSHPESTTAQLVDSLRKAGLSDQDLSGLTSSDSLNPVDSAAATSTAIDTSPNPSRNSSISGAAHAEGESSQDEGGPERPPIRKKSVSFTADTKRAPDLEPVRGLDDFRKSVSFAEKVAVAPAAAVPDTRSVSFSPKIEEIPAQQGDPAPSSDVTKDLDMQKTLRSQFKPGEKVIELNDDDEIAATHIVMPENESPEDAQLRREMLEYHLNEVGHVVAQIDLDDDYADGDDTTSASDFTPSEYQDEDTPYTSGLSDSESDDEDEYGRSKRRVLTDAYHKEMQALERRLIGNLGPDPSANDVGEVDADLDPSHVHRLVIREKRSSISSISSDGDKKSSSKKRVSFAEAVDVADSTSPPLKALKTQEGENAAPMKDAISERSPAITPAVPNSTAAPKVSRFKQARAIPANSELDHDGDDSGPKGKILADQLVERPTVAHRTAPPSADEPDPIMQRRQLAAEYYRRRNDLIRQQGGFKADPAEEDDEPQWTEDDDGKLKKVSRFKAARIKS